MSSRIKARNGSSKEENEEELHMWTDIKGMLKKLSAIQKAQQQVANEIFEIEKDTKGAFVFLFCTHFQLHLAAEPDNRQVYIL